MEHGKNMVTITFSGLERQEGRTCSTYKSCNCNLCFRSVTTKTQKTADQRQVLLSSQLVSIVRVCDRFMDAGMDGENAHDRESICHVSIHIYICIFIFIDVHLHAYIDI